MTIRRAIIEERESPKRDMELKQELEEVVMFLENEKNRESKEILKFILSNKDQILKSATDNLEKKDKIKITTFYPME